MLWLPRVAAVLLLLVLGTGCGRTEEEAGSTDATAEPSSSATGSPPAAVTPVAPPPVAPAQGAGCDEGPVFEVMCRFVAAAQTGDTSALGEVEQETASAVGSELPDSDYVAEDCWLVGDVTIACEVLFSGQPTVLGFHVVPANAEYNDGELITPDGEDVRYEVDGYLGTGERGEFASLP